MLSKGHGRYVAVGARCRAGALQYPYYHHRLPGCTEPMVFCHSKALAGGFSEAYSTAPGHCTCNHGNSREDHLREPNTPEDRAMFGARIVETIDGMGLRRSHEEQSRYLLVGDAVVADKIQSTYAENITLPTSWRIQIDVRT
jgi:hypothetical protein